MIEINTILKSRAQASLGQFTKELVFWALALLLLAAPVMRGLFYDIEFMKAQMLMGGVILLYGLNRIFNGEEELTFNILDGLVLSFLAAYLLSLINAVHFKEALWGAFKVLNYVLLFFLVSDLAREKQRRKRLIVVLFLSTVLIAGTSLLINIEILKITIESEFSGSQRLISFLEYQNTFGIFSAMGIMLGLGILLNQKKLMLRALSVAGIYLNIVALLGTQSRGSWLVFALVLVLWLVFIGEKQFWPNVYCTLAVGLPAMVASKAYLDSFYAKEYGSALLSLAGGLLASALLISLLTYLPRFLQRFRFFKKFRNVLVWVAVIFIAVAGLTYFSYAAKYLPNTTSQLLSVKVIDRAESIDGQEGSFLTRMDLNRIALEMVKENPLFGTGEGGWEAFYHQHQQYFYWSSEVHNNFYQIWVEAGTLGFLSYLGVWIFLLWKVAVHSRKRKKSSNWTRTFSVFLALLVLLLHSGFDFDLSYPAVTFALWSLGAILACELRNYEEKRKVLVPPLPLTALAVLALTVLLVYPAWREYKACYLVKEGDYALHMGYYPRAVEKYEEAFSFSPLSGDTAAKLAKAYAGRLQNSTKIDYIDGFNFYVSKAYELSPRSEAASWYLIDAYKLRNDSASRLQEEERYVSLVPKYVPGLERLAESYLSEGLLDLENGQIKEAWKCFELCLDVTEQIEENYRLGGEKSNMRLSAQGHLLAGKSYLFLNDYENAVLKLKRAESNAKTRNEVRTLLALVYEKSNPGQAINYFNKYVNNDADNTALYNQYKYLLTQTGGER